MLNLPAGWTSHLNFIHTLNWLPGHYWGLLNEELNRVLQFILGQRSSYKPGATEKDAFGGKKPVSP